MPLSYRIFTFFLLLGLLLPAAAKPQRIVSIGLCTDQLLLMLAEPGQIASVSTWSTNREMSYMVDSVGDIPLNNASIEEVIRLRPDLVVASNFVARDTVRFLRKLGFRVEQMPVATSITQIYELLAQFGDWVGNPERAQRQIEQMRARLREMRARYADRPAKRVIIYSPNGFTIGTNTLEHDLFVEAGYRNLAAEMGIEGFQAISLERLIAADPDVILVEHNLSPQPSLATAYLGHPALAKTLRERELLDIPTRLRICAGPMIVEAVEQMAARR